MKLYGLKNCDSCKNALTAIKNAGKNIEFIDIKSNFVSPDTIKSWLEQHSEAVLINRKSTTWRKLDDADRQLPVPELMQTHPTVIKRPVIVVGEQSYIGWNSDVKSALGIS